MKSLIGFPFLILLCSCSATQLMEIPLDSMVEGAKEGVKVIGDSSVAKEAIVHKTIQSYHKAKRKMYDKSGIKISFNIVKKKGLMVILPDITYREKPELEAPPIAPSVHPVWPMVNNVLDKGLTYGFGYLAVDSVVGAFKALGTQASNAFYGDANLENSFNVAGGYQDFKIDNTSNCSSGECGEDSLNFDLGTCEETPPFGTINGVTMFSSGCSCGSHANHDC